MRLQPVSLRGRRFLIQFNEVMSEFGSVIPWLDGMDEMRFATNGEWFRDELLRRTGQREGNVTPYQFVDGNGARTYAGGILLFEKSPETLRDPRNREIEDRLAHEKSSFISCLQVRESRRDAGLGTKLMTRAVAAIRGNHGSTWGVVSDRRLLPWYASLGAQTPSPVENEDRLWIVSWSR